MAAASLAQRLFWTTRRRFSAQPLAEIKRLRDLSGAPLGDVKKALEESGYDFELAYEALRRKGLAAAAKKASRIAVDGLVGVATTPGAAALIEVNCETDFVARNAKFCSFVEDAARAILSQASSSNGELLPEAYLQLTTPTLGTTIEDGAVALSGSIREKVAIRRAFRLTTPGVIFTYCHNAPPGEWKGLGKIGSAVALESADGRELSPEMRERLAAAPLGQQLAMQVAAMRPLYRDRDAVAPEHLAKERALYRQQALESGKPEKIVDKIVDGRLEKFFEEFCLMDQKFVMDDDVDVASTLKALAPNTQLAVAAFLRVQCGEKMDGMD